MRKMDRRDALKRAALLTGFAISAPIASAVLSGCQPEVSTTAYQPQFFTADEFAMIQQMTDLMLPRTETPGALDVGVPEFMDRGIGIVAEEKNRLRFRSGLQQFAQGAETEYGKPFLELKPEEQLDYMNQVDTKAKAAKTNPNVRRPKPEDRPFFLNFKQWAIAGYFSSEQVGLEVLNYDPVPGVYQGCIPLADVGEKSWSLQLGPPTYSKFQKSNSKSQNQALWNLIFST